MVTLALLLLLAPPALGSPTVPGSLRSPACSGGEAAWVLRGESGVVLEEGACRDGRPHGAWTFRHENGVVAAQGEFVRGERHGHWVFRFPDGSLASEGSYVLGLEDGRWIERSANGDTEEGDYKGGERVGTWTVKAPGVGEVSLQYDAGEPAWLHAAAGSR